MEAKDYKERLDNIENQMALMNKRIDDLEASQNKNNVNVEDTLLEVYKLHGLYPCYLQIDIK